MLGVKRGTVRFFALPMRQFFLFICKITLIIVVFLFILYRVLAYFNGSLVSRMQKYVNKQQVLHQLTQDRKRLELELSSLSLTTDKLRLKLKRQHQAPLNFYDYAEKSGITVFSYEQGPLQQKKQVSKEIQTYTMQASAENIVTFFELLLKEKFPVFCVSLKAVRQQDNMYTLSLVLKRYKEHKTKAPSTRKDKLKG